MLAQILVSVYSKRLDFSENIRPTIFCCARFLAAGVSYFMSKAYSTAAAASVAPFEYVYYH